MFVDAIHKIQTWVEDAYKKIGTNNRSTKKYMDYEKTANGARIKVPFWFFTFEKGRGPRDTKTTQTSKPETTVAGTKMSAFEVRLYEWMQSRGKLTGTLKQKINQAKSLRYWINQNGTELYQKGGRKDIYSNVINDKAISQLMNDVGNDIAKVTSDIISDFGTK